MGFYVDRNNNYYEGDPQRNSIAVPKRPSTFHTWDGTAWVEDTSARWDEIRTQRDALLAESDWTHTTDTPLDAPTLANWAAYRQELRDIPQTYADPDSVIWPTKPV